MFKHVVGMLCLALLVICAGATMAPGQANSASISGRVIVDGHGLPGITVVLMQAPTDLQNAVQQMMQGGGAGVRVETDLDGSFHFGSVAAGHYMVAPFAPAFISEGNTNNASDLTLADGESVSGIDFSMKKGGVVTGKVTSPDGRPVINASMSFTDISISSGFRISGARNFTTDDRGVYRIYGLVPGKYKISVSIPGASSNGANSGQSYYPGVQDATNAEAVDVTGGKETTGIDIKLAAVPTARFKVSGRVTDESGNPVTGIPVVCGPTLAEGNSFNRDGEPVITNTSGEFTIQGLRPGSYKASVAPNWNSGSSGFSNDESFEIQDSDVSGVVIHWRPGGSIAGTVTIDGDADPAVLQSLSQQQVSAFVASANASPGFGRSPVGSDGSFTIQGLPPGHVNLSMGSLLEYGASGFRVSRVEVDGAPVKDSITLGDGQQLTGVRVVVAVANCSITGTVTVTGGSLPPGTGLQVFAVSASSGSSVSFSESGAGALLEAGGSGGSAVADSNGRFQIQNLVAGTYNVQVAPVGPAWKAESNVPTASKQVTVTGGGSVDVVLTLDLSTQTSTPKQ